MIIPINGHILIKPLSRETMYMSNQTSYEERGEVLSLGAAIYPDLHVGDAVYFDSWLAAKYFDASGNEHWLIPYDKIRAIEPCN
ncbi:MAG: hypothetical protein KGJ90_02205 [Patescibacteria group bacterium]|nr:hypothetical protein [Patescibacteria group bacterium]